MKKNQLFTIVAAAASALVAQAQASSLTISEVVYNEVGSAFSGEWIEIYNGTNAPIDLSSYKIGDEETQLGTTETEVMSQFPAGATIAPGEVQILSSFASRFAEVYGFRPTYEYGSTVAADNFVDDTLVPNMTVYTAWDADGAKLNMSNSNDQVLFLDPVDARVDAVNWGNTVFLNPGASASAGDGQSLARVQTDADTDTATDWALTSAAPANVFWTTRSTPGTVNLAPITWTNDAEGDFADPVQYTAGAIENTYGRVVKFGSAITANRTIALSEDRTVYAVEFDNASASYTLTGTATLTLNSSFGGGKVSVVSGSHTIASGLKFVSTGTINVATGAEFQLVGPLTATNAAIVKTGGGVAKLPGVKATSLLIQEGSIAINAESTAQGSSVLNTLVVNTGASLDLNRHALVLDYDSAGTSPIGDVVAMIADGRILSAIGAGDSSKAIAVIDTAVSPTITTVGEVALDGSSVVARLSFKGDTNLDAAVNFDDLLALAQNYGSAAGNWTTGDSNGDLQVNFDDLLALAQNYGSSSSIDALNNAGVSSSFTADWRLALSLAPEPTTMTALIGAAAMIRRRRSI